MSETGNTESNKNVSVVTIEDEMRGAYLDYAMSVIVGRALPDVRDGLNPFIAAFCTRCTKWGTTGIRPIKNPLVSSVM